MTNATPGLAELLLPDGRGGRGWQRFEAPSAVMVANRREEVLAVLGQVEAELDRGRQVVGFLAYEAASAFDSALVTYPPTSGLPLAWFAAFETSRAIGPPRPGPRFELQVRPELEYAAYRRRVQAVHQAIARGDTYQVNLTFPLRGGFPADPRALFGRLWHRQPVAHAAYLDLGRFVVCSASPELFFAREGRRLVTRPMKGTAARGPYPAADAHRARELEASPKDRAENLMIVDMMRNDLGRVARPGSVRVERLFEVERYRTVWQLTSTVTAETDRSTSEVLAALFPSASITGAPKASSMGLIRQLEDGPRGVYTGAIGWFGPGRRVEMNVAIRTAVVDRERAEVEYRTGGGVVWDSRPEAEYEECAAKARVFVEAEPDYRLLETLLWRPHRGYWLLRGHLERLAASAAFLDRPCPSGAEIRRRLESVAGAWPRRSHKVRLLVDAQGEVAIEAAPLARRRRGPWTVGLADAPIDPTDPFLYHKTTRRDLYRRAVRSAPPEWDDVLLWNPDGELTESTVANLVVGLEGARWTPPVGCGLLDGVYRRHLLRRGEVRERRLTAGDLAAASEVWLVSSVRGWIPVRVAESSTLSAGTERRGGPEV